MSVEPSTLGTQERAIRGRLRDWLQLCRLPNVFTAMADPLAGALVMGAGWRETGRILIVMAASGCFYAAGIILNDWHDYRRDLVERPTRPLPAGRISRWRALLAAITLLAIGQLLASALGTSTGGISLLVVVFILLYDVLMKDIPVAPALMGAARALNLLMGMSLIDDGSGTLRAYLAIALGLYVLGLTVFARRETGLSRKDQLLLGAGFMAVPLPMAALLRAFFTEMNVSAGGAIWLAALAGVVGYPVVQAILTPAPARIQRAVKAAILGIVLFDAALVAFHCGFLLSLLVAALIIPAMWLGRRLYST